MARQPVRTNGETGGKPVCFYHKIGRSQHLMYGPETVVPCLL